MLSGSERNFLLKLARDSVESVVNDRRLPRVETCSPALLQPCGAFVTLRQEGELRGCIGYTDATRPLAETVQDAAVKAATEDPRFLPVSPDELASIRIEISVLSPMTPVGSAAEIEIGRHGLMLESKGLRGLLLPQVPVEYGWDVQTFLSQVSRKAGLPAQAWKDPGSSLCSFTAEIFSEHSPEPAAR